MKEATAPEPLKVSQVLRTYFLNRYGVTQQQLADALRVSRHSVNELLNDKRSVTAPMALRLARVLGTDSHFWMNLQMERDLFDARQELASEINGIEPLVAKPAKESFLRKSQVQFSDEGRLGG